jgi:oxygen-independent coproporphyrinogen III oxidase
MEQNPQLARLGLFDARVPRYTSYPTAPQFAGTVGEDEFRSWVGAIAPGSEISLYLHVPFCRRLCWFCACRTQGTSSDAPVIAYVDVLKAELRHLAAILPAGVTLSRLHWGGGTPTMLSPAAIRDLAAAVFAVTPMAPGGEFSVEIDPDEVDGPRLDALAEMGLNRASIGVQDFDPTIQATIGRDQPFDLTARVVEAIRARGIPGLNADLVYGLPHQTRARLTDTVHKLLSFSPERVALYGYAHVPWMARRQQMIPTDSLPRAEERLELFETARKLFAWDGYAEIGIDHFARPGDGLARAAEEGRLRRNFQGYTDDNAPVLIGLGASSISRFPQGYAQMSPSTSGWTKAVRAGRFAIERGHAFVGDDRLRGRIIEALMCDFAVRSDELIRDFGVSPAQLADLIGPVAERFAGFVDAGPDGLSIRPEGKPLTRMIASGFDGYVAASAGYSAAV